MKSKVTFRKDDQEELTEDFEARDLDELWGLIMLRLLELFKSGDSWVVEEAIRQE